MLSVAFLGCAHIHTNDYLQALQQRPDMQIVAMWDHDINRANEYAQRVGCSAAQTIDEVLTNDLIDAVIICSETVHHNDLVRATVATRKPLFVEKPLGMRADEAQRIADVIEHADVLFQTGYFLRYHPSYQLLQQNIQQGHFGTITHVHCALNHSGLLGGWFDDEWRWMADPAQAGLGAFGDLGVHMLDVLLWMFGPAERVTADVATLTGRYGTIDEYGSGILRFQNGLQATLTAGWVDFANPISLIVQGTEGAASLTKEQLHIQTALNDSVTEPVANPPRSIDALNALLDTLTGQTSAPLIQPREAALRNQLVEALYRGAHHQRWVFLDELAS
ncbi:MAG: Gfo/Idh/MocA family oxidoreductase [Chloroflexota bacterium]